MSDAIKHECGIAVLRLKKPLDFYLQKYGTSFYALNKMYLMMEKQHNRGQDGAGLVNIKLDMKPGQRYISRHRSIDPKPIQDIFNKIHQRFAELADKSPEILNDTQFLKENAGFTGEVFLGHLRYGTFGRNSIENCHPFLRQSNWMTKNLVVAGNFNMTNVDELFDVLVNLGQHPKEKSDTVTVMEKIGHFLDVENDQIFAELKKAGYSNTDIYAHIAKNINIPNILEKASEDWDGGYAMAGILGHGDTFVLRDPNGIRPAFWYEDDEVCVVCSERPVIQTAFNCQPQQIHELTPGAAIIIKKDGSVKIEQINEPQARLACSFERIYFSRGNDLDIYEERKMLGNLVCPQILQKVNYDLDNTVFSFIPNTAETAFYGMIKALEDHLNDKKFKAINLAENKLNDEQLQTILFQRARIEKIAIKDAKLRTFITQDNARDDMVAHVYDMTYGSVRRGQDTLVVIDDSIVRGTTLKQSILKMLDRLGPKKIIVVSSAPQIRYPDCYGIDMAKMGDFIAFQAAMALHKDNKTEQKIHDIYIRCKEQENLPKELVKNYVKEVYSPFDIETINKKIAHLLTPKDINAEVEVIYQSIENLHQACPNHLGDWYFTGNYPTPGGNKVVNKAFINYIEGNNNRAY
jgi:amidophosphoribosyltransferase